MDAEGVLESVVQGFVTGRQYLDVEELARELERQAAEVERRAERSEAFLASLKSEEEAVEAAEVSEEEAENTKLEEILWEKHAESIRLEAELKALEELEDRLATVQEQHWRQLNATGEKKHNLQERVHSLQMRTDILIGCRKALKQTNALNDAFCIWYDGPFGTIGGLRLGRLPDAPVEWAEINAAWGQAALLLSTLARQVHFSFSKYRIIPQGSVSKMAKVGSEKTSYELYCTGGFFKTSFNNAMVCILHCVQELGEYAEKTDRTMQLPYPIDGDKVGGLTVRTSSSDENWTKALKNFLADLKWLVAWSTKRQQRM